MTEANISPKPPADFKKILNESVYPNPGLTAEQQEKFVNQYSFSALILQFVYYFVMGDALLAWGSLICSVSIVLTPLIVVFPFWARRRAYQKRTWSSFNEFYHNQKKWDREATYLAIVSIVLVVVSLWLIGPMILKSAQVLTGQSGSTDFTQQLQDAVQQYRDILN
ncbi:MAG: hypothetical protein NUV85_02210 [Candidatus Berkelbacteria bacterium]|nr:hypothetical protein [Candidatus Berkelbacteria bacterium]